MVRNGMNGKEIFTGKVEFPAEIFMKILSKVHSKKL